MIQQIEFIIYTNIQTLRQKFFTKGQGQRFKKMFCYHDNLENNYCIFYVKLLMSMEMT